MLGRFEEARHEMQLLIDMYETERDGPIAGLTTRDPKVSICNFVDVGQDGNTHGSMISRGSTIPACARAASIAIAGWGRTIARPPRESMTFGMPHFVKRAYDTAAWVIRRLLCFSRCSIRKIRKRVSLDNPSSDRTSHPITTATRP